MKTFRRERSVEEGAGGGVLYGGAEDVGGRIDDKTKLKVW